MAFFRRSPQTRYVEEHAQELVDRLAYFCAIAARDICKALKETLPAGATEDTVCMTLLALRAEIESDEIRRKVGRRAQRVLLARMEATYGAGGPYRFEILLGQARKVLSEERDPREWLRRLSMRFLGTVDPDDELFHVALSSGLVAGERIMTAIERGTA